MKVYKRIDEMIKEVNQMHNQIVKESNERLASKTFNIDQEAETQLIRITEKLTRKSYYDRLRGM